MPRKRSVGWAAKPSLSRESRTKLDVADWRNLKAALSYMCT